jgi:CRISPR/Cas system Type II protein with McrA/HNH and RuvC-like nuclease domain
MKEALRYLQNAREILKNAPVEDNTYTDVKYVQEACATAYLAVLKAIDQFLAKAGVNEKDLPQSVDGYRDMLKKYAIVQDGKLLKEFEKLYKALHIAGYYRGLLEDVTMVKDALRAAKSFIDKFR